MIGTVIELDRERVDRPHGEPRLPPRRSRWLGLAMTVIVCEAVLAADSPSSGRLHEVARVDPASVVTMQVAGSMLFAAMLRGGPHLVGYRLTDGAQQWSTPLPVSGVDWQVGPIDVVDGAVLVSMHSSQPTPRTVAVDAATGRQLWHSDLPQVIGDGLNAGSTVVLSAYLNPDGSPGAAPYPGTDGLSQPLLLRGVRARTGRMVWTRQVPMGWRTVLPAGAGIEAPAEPASGFVVINPNGQATTVDLATGQVQASTMIDAVAVNQGNTPGDLVQVYGDQLVLVTTRPDGPALAAYRVSTLGLQWTAPLPPTQVSLWPCSPWLCVTYMDGIHAITPATGTPAWSMTNSTQFGGWVAGWISTPTDPTHPDAGALIDPATQRVVLNLGRWRIATPSNAASVLLTAVVPGSTQTWLGLLATGPRIELLGVVDALPHYPCQVTDGYLACLTNNDQLRIWRY